MWCGPQGTRVCRVDKEYSLSIDYIGYLTARQIQLVRLASNPELLVFKWKLWGKNPISIICKNISFRNIARYIQEERLLLDLVVRVSTGLRSQPWMRRSRKAVHHMEAPEASVRDDKR